MERGFVGLNVAVLAIGDALSVAEEPPAKLVLEKLEEAGHRVVAQRVLADNRQLISGTLLEWIADPEIDVVIATAGVKAEHAVAALDPLATRWLDGFRDLFRLLTYNEIGSAAMLVDAEAALCKSTLVFVLPSSVGAVRTALTSLLIPQLDNRTKPRNAVMLLPRVSHEALPEKERAEAPAPWIVPKQQTAKLNTVAEPKTAIPKTPPPFEKKETTNVGPPPPPSQARTKTATVRAPLPVKPPAMQPIVIAGPAEPPEAIVPDVTADAVPEPTPLPTPVAAAVAALEPAADDDVGGFDADKILEQPKPRPRNRETTVPPDSIVRTRELRGDDQTRSTLIIPRQRRPNTTGYVVAGLFAIAAVMAVFVVYVMVRGKPKAASAQTTQGPVAQVDPPVPPPEDPPPPVTDPAPIDDGEIVMGAGPTGPTTPAEPTTPTRPATTPPRPATTPPARPTTTTTAERPTTTTSEEPAVAPADLTTAPKNAETDGCDEVSCILDKFARPCCEKYKPAEAPPPKPSSGLPPALDKAMIQASIGKLKPVVVRCGEQHAVKGTVSLRVVVSPEGEPTVVSVKTSPDEALGSCVATAIRKASFPKTDAGGSFVYPFVF